MRSQMTSVSLKKNYRKKLRTVVTDEGGMWSQKSGASGPGYRKTVTNDTYVTRVKTLTVTSHPTRSKASGLDQRSYTQGRDGAGIGALVNFSSPYN